MITGQELKNILKEIGITQKRCGEHTQINESYISEFITGRRDLDSQQMIRLNNYVDKLRAIL